MGQFSQFFTKRNIIQGLLVLIIMLGIPFAVSLVKQQQQLRSRASTDNIFFTGPNVKLVGGKEVAVDPKIRVKVVAPGNAVANTTPTPAPAGPTPTPTATPAGPTPTPTPTAAPANPGGATPTVSTTDLEAPEAGLVTIRGTNFGTTKGSVKYSRGGGDTLSVVVDVNCSGCSWADNQIVVSRIFPSPGDPTAPDAFKTKMADGQYIQVCSSGSVCSSWTIMNGAGSGSPSVGAPSISPNPVAYGQTVTISGLNPGATMMHIRYWPNDQVNVRDGGKLNSGNGYSIQMAINESNGFQRTGSPTSTFRIVGQDASGNDLPNNYTDIQLTFTAASGGPSEEIRSVSSNGLLASLSRLELVKNAYALADGDTKTECIGQCINGNNCTNYERRSGSWVAISDSFCSTCGSCGTAAPPPPPPAAPPPPPPPPASANASCACTVNCGAGQAPKCWSCPPGASDRQGVVHSDYFSYCDPNPNTPPPPAAPPPPASGGQPTTPPATTPPATTPPGATASPAGQQGGALPSGVTITKYKVTDEPAAQDANDPIWNSISQRNYSNGADAENVTDFEFTPKQCTAGQSCDPYPVEDRVVFVLFTGTGPGGTPFKQVVSASITLAVTPEIKSISCSVSPTGGTSVIVTGLHLGDSQGTVTIDDQALDPSSVTWTKNRVTANYAGSLGDKKVALANSKNNSVSSAKGCTPNKARVDIKAAIACRTVDKALKAGEVEIKDLTQEGTSSAAPTTQGVSIYKNAKESFDEEGKPTGASIKDLEEGKNYAISIKAPGTTRKIIKFKALKGTTVLNDIELPLGDIAPSRGDNKINAFDRAELLQEWSAVKDAARPGDFNLDSRINSLDDSCLKSNYNKSGDD